MGPSDMIGRTLSHYTLVSELGRGGMGIVYRAFDTTLDREVALKVLLPEFVADPERRRRFVQEAKAAASLEHPHIGTVYEVGEADGTTFIAMQLISGERLRDMLQRGSLPAVRAVELGLEIAEGLSTAHDKGIVHRDLTPANVIVNDDGHAKIIDFGLAKLIEPLADRASEAETRQRTEMGVVMGTTAYMSPEQARGEPADHRSDLFTLGTVLYEMVSGATPFSRASGLETLNAIVNAPDPPLTLAPGLEASSELQRIVHKCLAKNPRDRYQTAKDLVVDLRELRRRLDSGSHAPVAAPQTSRRGRLWAAVAIAAVALTALAGYLINIPERPTPGAITGERKRIAVLVFQNLGPADDEYFAAGVTEEITSRLASISQLAVISRNSVLQYSNTGKNSQQVGRELGVDFILQGTVRWQPAKEGAGRVRVTPQLVRVADETQVWADSYERQLDEIFAVQADIAARVSQQLGAAILAPERKLIEMTPTANLAAYQEYLRGNFLFFHKSGSASQNRLDASAFFQRAVELDPTFAVAHAAVANAAAHRFFYVDAAPEWEQRADSAIETALRLDPNLADAYLARGNLLWTQARGFPHERAIREYRRALALNPNLAEARVALGRLYNHVGLLDESREELTMALQLDPANAEAPARLVNIYDYEHDNARALAGYERLSGGDNWSKILQLSYLGRDQEARAMAARLLPVPWTPNPDDRSNQFNIVLLARAGERARVEAAMPRVEAIASNAKGLSHLHHTQYNVGLAYAVLGRNKEAVAWLRRAAAGGLPNYPYFAKDPNLASLAGDADFAALLSQLKAQQEQLRAFVRAPLP